MKKRLSIVFLFIVFMSGYVSATEYPKVILRGDYPDPSIIRDGKDYYMTHSPFYYTPGFLIWHSTDLIHWEPLTRAMTKVVGSAMAPDLVKHNGRYYIYFPANGTNWVIWADNIQGPWSDPIDLKVGDIDPGHVVGEDGKRYLHLSGGNMIQLADDGLSTVGKPWKTYEGWEFPSHWETEGMWLESPKLIKKDGYFHLVSAEGGTAGPPTSHMVVSARSKSVKGPWENSPYNPIVHTYSADEKWWSKGHGTLVDDTEGNWWIVYHAYENGFYTLGRQTLIEPVQWLDDGWFRSVKKHTPVRPETKTNNSNCQSSTVTSQLTSWKEYNPKDIEFKDKSIYLKGKGTSPQNARLLLATVPDKNYEVTVEVNLENGGTGGLVLFYDEKAFAGISSDGRQFTVYESADKQTKTANKFGRKFLLKIKNKKNSCTLQASKDGSEWETLTENLDVSAMHHNNYKGFYALRVGLMAAGNTKVRFNDFVYKPLEGKLFAYGTDKNKSKNGLHLAWSEDGKSWDTIGPEYSFVRCDYGNWGSEKRMIAPVTVKGDDGLFHCMWTLNEYDDLVGHAATKDFINWSRQSYVEKDHAWYALYKEKVKESTTTRLEESVKGAQIKVPLDFIDDLLFNVSAIQKKELKRQGKENISYPTEPVKATITLDPSRTKKISDELIGIFYEDINYAADGGLYAELIQNRGFEYSPKDVGRDDGEWNAYKAWELLKDSKGEAAFSIDTVNPIHPNNKHYAVLQITKPGKGIGLANEGFNGIPVKAGESYDYSLFTRTISGKPGNITIRLIGKTGEVYGEAKTTAITKEWQKLSGVITSNATVDDARLAVYIHKKGTVALDMISLFPQKTFKNRKNGLRADLAQAIADLNPRFVRFPGGCLAHGDGLANMYRWKNTIGPLEARVPQPNIWRYHQTAGLGYFEFFQFCEDLGAEPVPVLAAGVCCQNSKDGGQKGFPMCEMHNYVQEVLDLIEYANGPVTSTWGKQRAEAGHPEPFNLKYLGIGNEDLISDIFEERFEMIYKAVREKHPEIVIIGTAGPFNEGNDYVEGWAIIDKLGVPMVDEHYYQTPGWFINNQDFYDAYNRKGGKVYLGEYAAHVPNRHNNIESALAEAIYMASLERNADIVHMASYAPLLAKEGFTQWNPDLIYFNNTEVKPTVGYYVQQLYGQHAGDAYIPSCIDLSVKGEGIEKRVAVSVVKDTKNNDFIVKLINLLPIPVTPKIELNGIKLTNGIVTKYVLQGEPADRDAKPVKTQCTVSEMLKSELPAYSFTVYRVSMD